MTAPKRGITARLYGLRARLRSTLFRRTADHESDEEIRFHLDMETEKNVRAGMVPHEARRRANAAFGGVERHRQRLREGRRVPLLEPIWHDVRFGLRSLARDPGLSLVAVLTVSLGVGATTTVFSAANGMLLRPLHLPEVERLVSVQEVRSGSINTGVEGMLIPYARFLSYREATEEVFESFAAHRLDQALSLRLAEETVAVSGALTSGNYFQTLRIQPELGRVYTSDEAAEIVISHDLWSTWFGRDPGVLGRRVGLDGRSVTIVGVAPAGFGGATFVADQVWAPVGVRGDGQERDDVGVVPLGRVQRGVTVEQAAAAVDAVGLSLIPDEGATVHSVRLEALSAVPAEARGPVSGFFAILMGMALLVLLIAAANIAGVMLARGSARRREMAVRMAMGAGRGRVVRHLLAESLAVFSAGGLLGVGLAYLGTALMVRIDLPPQAPSLSLHLAPDGRVLAFAVVLMGVTGAIFGLVPAVRLSRPELVPALKTGSAGSTGGEGRTRSHFVIGQVALAVTLLLTGALFARSLQKGLQADLGFDPGGVVAANIDLAPPLDYDEERGRAFRRTLLERVRARPGVEQAAWSLYVLASGSSSSGDVRRADAPELPSVNASYTVVTPDYFETMRIELEAGRGFTRGDIERAPLVAVINRTLAERLFPGENPLGRSLEGFGAGPSEIVGVTAAGRYALITEQPRAFVFLPYEQVYRSSMALHVRAGGEAAATLRAVAEEVRALDADVALGLAGSARDLVGFSLFPQRFALQLVGTFGVIGLILASIGIYGVLAYEVSRRTRELGVRRAIGATSAMLLRSVVRRGVVITAAGCAIGMVAGAALALLVRSFLFGIQPLDPVTFTVVPALLFVVAFLASWLPGLRASSVEPSEALRAD